MRNPVSVVRSADRPTGAAHGPRWIFLFESARLLILSCISKLFPFSMLQVGRPRVDPVSPTDVLGGPGFLAFSGQQIAQNEKHEFRVGKSGHRRWISTLLIAGFRPTG